MAQTVEDDGFDTEDLKRETRKLRILGFNLDRRGENIVSRVNGAITFIDTRYNGDKVLPGDIWLCSVEPYDAVYYATPLRRITSTMLLGMSEEMRNGIVDALWRTNKAEFVKTFEKNYREQVYQQAYEHAKKEDEDIIAGLKDEVEELRRQVEHSRMIIDQRTDEEYLELGSEDEEPARPPVAQTQIQPAAAVQAPAEDSFNPVFGRSVMMSAPGMPEVRLQEAPQARGQAMRCTVERLADETIYSEAFVDGKYFVHITPSKKFIVIRKHDYGSAICIRGRIRLVGLGKYCPFSERRQLMAEYSPRFDGLLVHLQ